MNLILFDSNEIYDQQITFSGERARHIFRILQSQVGDLLRVGQVGGLMGTAKVLRLGPESCQVEVVQLDKTPPAKEKIRVFCALPRPKSLPRILRDLTTLGIEEIHFFNAWKVEKHFWSSDYLSPQKMLRACMLGLEQSIDTQLPKIHFHRLFRPFVEDQFEEIVGDGCLLLADPYGPILTNFELEKIQSSEQWVNLVFGPEGGFIDYERDQLLSKGCRLFQFGERVLRLETALTAITARFMRLSPNSPL